MVWTIGRLLLIQMEKTTTVIKPRTVDGLEVNIEFDGRETTNNNI